MANLILEWVWKPSRVSMRDQRRLAKIKVEMSMRQFPSTKKSMTTPQVLQVQLEAITRSNQRKSHSRNVNSEETNLRREPSPSTRKKIQTKARQKKPISHNILRFQQLPLLVLQCSWSRPQGQFKLSRCHTTESSESSRSGSSQSMRQWETLIWASISRTSTRTQAGEMTESQKWMGLSILKRAASRTSEKLMRCKKAVWHASSKWSVTSINIAYASRLGSTTPKFRRGRVDSQLSPETRSTEQRCEDCSSRGVEFLTNGSRRDSTERRRLSEWSSKVRCLSNGPPRSTRFSSTWPS